MKAMNAARVRARRMPAFARGCAAIETIEPSSPFAALPLSFLSSFLPHRPREARSA